MAVQIDDSFMADLGLGNASDEQKRTLMQQVLEMLEVQVGLRLTEDLTDDQMDEFERFTEVHEGDTPEMLQQKQAQAAEWLKMNHPDYEQVIAEELEKIKSDLGRNLNVVMDGYSS